MVNYIQFSNQLIGIKDISYIGLKEYNILNIMIKKYHILDKCMSIFLILSIFLSILFHTNVFVMVGIISFFIYYFFGCYWTIEYRISIVLPYYLFNKYYCEYYKTKEEANNRLEELCKKLNE